jgi:hypothetical protein
MSFDLPPSKTKLRDISQVFWKRPSGDPRHPCNALDADWQAGYLLGCFTSKESSDDICAEWKRRDKPKSASQYDDTIPERSRVDAWKSWKAGYWSGRYTRL